MKDEPIITSLLDIDFYKFTMGYLAWLLYRSIDVTYGFKNRTSNVLLGTVIDEGQLREELDHVRTLRANNSELHYLRGTNEYGKRMFEEGYLQFFKGLQLPPYLLERKGDNYELHFKGSWAEGIYWETIALSIVNELYYRKLLNGFTRFERECVMATGRLRLAEKIAILRQHPDIMFSDFGTRRRFSRDWQYYVVETLANELPEQLLGTSNTFAAMKYGLLPMGTSAHELPMIMAGASCGGISGLREAQRHVLDDWWRTYGEGLSIFLPDTFGSDFFFRVVTDRELRIWKGFRWDSGDAFAFGDRVIAKYEELGIDPKQKLLVPSDGLDLPMILKLNDYFGWRIKMSYGWGTNLTNDLLDNQWHNGLWYGPLSLVVKPIEANGQGLVKLSDNLSKATGKPEDIERYKTMCEYTGTFNEACKY